jgi:hypothetical protein
VPALRFGEAHGQSSALPLRKMLLLVMFELALFQRKKHYTPPLRKPIG